MQPSLPRQQTEEIDKMNRNSFREFLHNVFNMTDDILMDRIFKYFDTLNNGLISREEWIMGLNIFLRGWWAWSRAAQAPWRSTSSTASPSTTSMLTDSSARRRCSPC